MRWQDDFRTQKLPKKSVSVFHIGAVWKGMAAVVTVKYWLRNCRWRLANKVLLILSISDPLLLSQIVSLTFEVYSYIIANFQIFLTLHSYHSPSIIVSRPEPFTNTLEIESVEMSLQNTYCSSTLKSTPTAVLNCLTGNIWSLVILGFKDIPLILFFLAYNRNASSVEKSNFLVNVESNLTLSGAYRMSIERFSTSEMEK